MTATGNTQAACYHPDDDEAGQPEAPAIPGVARWRRKTVEAGRQAVELAGPDVDSGAGWDSLALREMDDAVRRGDLAARMLRVSSRLAAAVFNRDQETIGRIIGGLTPEPLSEDVAALLVVQAALIAGAGAHATTDGLLAWVDFDEHGQALPCKVAPVIPLPGTGEHADAA